MVDLSEIPRRERRFYRRKEGIPEKEIYSFEEKKEEYLPKEESLEEFKRKIKETKEEEPKPEEILEELTETPSDEKEEKRREKPYELVKREIAEDISRELSPEEKTRMLHEYAKKEITKFKKERGRLPTGKELDLMADNIFTQLQKAEAKEQPTEEMETIKESPRERFRRLRMEKTQAIMPAEPEIKASVKELLKETEEIQPLDESEEEEENKKKKEKKMKLAEEENEEEKEEKEEEKTENEEKEETEEELTEEERELIEVFGEKK